MLADRDSLEASLYRDIVKSRLEAIRAFQSIVDADARRKCSSNISLTTCGFSTPRGARDGEIMESRLLTEGVVVDDLTAKEKLGRVDIKYRTAAGKHIIVELKKVGRKMELHELLQQEPASTLAS